MLFKYKLLVWVSLPIIIFDQLSKYLVNQYVVLGERISLVQGYLDLVHFRNPGAAFGMLAGMDLATRSLFFYGIAILATIMLTFYLRSLSQSERLMPVAISLIFGGMLGNIIDRVRFGEVIDFISCHYHHKWVHWDIFGKQISFVLEWPAFNVADSAITIAMFLIIISAFKGEVK